MNPKMLIVLLTLILAGVVLAITELESSKKLRFLLLVIGGLLFFVAGFFASVYCS